MCAVTSALGGSVTAPKSQNGSFGGSSLVLSTSKAPQPPSLALHAERSTRGRARRRRRSSSPARGAARARRRPCRRRRGSCRSRTRTGSRRRRGPAGAPPSRRGPAPRGRRASRAPRTTGVVRRARGPRRAARSARAPCPTPATGRPRSGGPASSSIVKLSSPASARASTGWSSAVAERVQAIIDQTHGGWIPPHEPSRSWRSTIQRSAVRSARRRSARDRPALVAVQRRGRAASNARPHGSVGARRRGARQQLVDRRTAPRRSAAAPRRSRARRSSAAPSSRTSRSRAARAAGSRISSGGIAGTSSHDQSESSESHMRVNTRARSTPPASRMNSAARAHVRGVGRVAREPQRDVGLDRGREVAGPAVEGRPGAVVALLARGSSARSPSCRARRRGCRGSGAGRDPRRRSSRWSRARPSTSRRGAGATSRCAARAVERLAAAASRSEATVTVMRPASCELRRADPAGREVGERGARRRRGRCARRSPSSRASRCRSTRRRGRGRGRGVRVPGRRRAAAGRGAERRARLARHGEVEHRRAARGRQQALERRAGSARAASATRLADLGVGAPRARPRRAGPRATPDERGAVEEPLHRRCRRRPRTARRARAGRSGRAG